MEKLNLIRLADVKAYIGLLDREEITMSRFAEILNECANEALRIHNVVGRSEQFISLIRELIDVGIIDEDDIEVETWVNNYLKEIN